ncbi:hypothetical protein SCHPADRAFT_146784 [Schizopora paradoxa]|uniref:DUF6533 domain-containing protein n=1 Tax=Schizopora paradoxa TaxID=27342 RepID=A0A0H2S8F4_9AGAM|nr:hypothetical protein SCHPADRAFT_146784 [Schizopora paradoxa]
MSVTLPGPVLTVLRDVQLMKYSNFFTVTMLVYDYMLTFGDEVRLIWPWEWRVGKILYIATKYSPFVDVPVFLAFWFNGSFSAAECQTLFNIGVWFVSAGAIISEWILCMRTYAIWEKSNIVFYPLLTFVLGAQIVGLWATKTLVSSLQFSLSPFPTLSRCYINETKTNVFFVVYILIMLVELTILTLTIWKGVSQWRSSRSALVKVLYRDGVFYFTVMFGLLQLTRGNHYWVTDQTSF